MAGVNDNLIPPVKGEVRNPGGKPKGTLNSKTIIKRWLSLTEDVKNPITGQLENMSQLDIMVLKQVQSGRKGDLRALRELLDRLEGKAQQSVDMTTQGEKMEAIVVYRPTKLEDTDI